MYILQYLFQPVCEILTRSLLLSDSGFTWTYAQGEIGTGTGGVSCGSTTTSTVVTFATCNAGGTMVEQGPVMTYPLVFAATTSEAAETLTAQSTIDSLTVWAPMIHIYWQSTDRETASTSETTFSTTSQTANTDNNISSSPVEISTGAIAGITIGCVIAGFAMGMAAIFLIRRRRQRRKTENLVGGANQATQYRHQQQQQQQQRWHHQDLTDFSELDSRTEPSKLPRTRLVSEMDGDYNRRC